MGLGRPGRSGRLGGRGHGRHVGRHAALGKRYATVSPGQVTPVSSSLSSHRRRRSAAS